MEKTYLTFTVMSGKVFPDISVKLLEIGPNKKIPAVSVGKSGPGHNKMAYVPVQLNAVQTEKIEQFWQVDIKAATLIQTSRGYGLIAREEQDVDCKDHAIIVLLTYSTVHGSNQHTGQRHEGRDPEGKAHGCLESFLEEKDLWFDPWPGKNLAVGAIAHGPHGTRGSGEQLITLMPQEKVFRTAYTGRLGNRPPAHYYIYQDGEVLCSTTKEEEEISDE